MSATSSAIPTARPISRSRANAFFILRLLLALAFIGAGCFKLSGYPAAVAEFDQVGLGQGFRYFTAAIEMLGAVLLLIPRAILYGALLMGAVCAGAFLAQLTVLHGDVVHTLVLAVFAAIAWTHRPRAQGVR